MRPGKSVTYLTPDGHGKPAVIVAVVGTGASGVKRLDLRLNDALVVLDVPHERDAHTGEGAWIEWDESKHDDALIVGETVTEDVEATE